jgi:membrane protein required for colicin V production
MNLVDLIVIAIVAISAILGLSRGFVREMLGLGSWLLAAYGAYRFGPQFIPMANRAIGNPDIAGVAAYVVVFLVLVIVFSLLANLVGRVVRVSALGGLDRTLGLVFGIVRGVAVMVVAYILGGAVLPHPWPPQIIQARTVPLLHDAAVWATGMIPDAYRPNVPSPPDDKPTTSAGLLQLTPAGSALGPRAVHN